MRSLIGTPSVEELGKYLEIYVEVNGRSVSKFQPLVEKILNRIGEWKNLTLFHAGQILLINAILASLRQHFFQFFLSRKELRIT